MKTERIREFDRIRSLLEHVYTYGFYSRQDFDKNGIVKNASYDKEVQRLYKLFDGSYLSGATQDGKRYLKINRSYFENGCQRLMKIFELHTMSEEGLIVAVLALSYGTREKFFGITTLEGNLWLGEKDCYKLARRHLISLKKAGYLYQKGKKFAICEQPQLNKLTEEQLVLLYQMTSFYATVGYPRVASYFLQHALKRKLVARSLKIPMDAFLFRGNSNRAIFDEDVLHTLAHACTAHCMVRADCTIPNGEECQQLCFAPVYLNIDVRLGRWYVFVLQDGKPNIFRISHLKKVTVLQETFDYEAAKMQLENAYAYNYVSFKRREKPILVEAELHFEALPAMRNQFERELFMGEIVTRDGTAYYRAWVNDPVELKPFLRSYGPYVRVIPSAEHCLAQDLANEFERMLKNYDAL